MALSRQSSVQLIYLIGSWQSGCLSRPNRDPLETDTAIVGQLSVTVIPLSSGLLIGVKHGVFALGLGAARQLFCRFCFQDVEVESCIARCWKPWERGELIWLVTCFSTLAAVSLTFFLFWGYNYKAGCPRSNMHCLEILISMFFISSLGWFDWRLSNFCKHTKKGDVVA